MILNFFEESLIRNDKLPMEWRDQNSLNELSDFLQNNWEQRNVFYNDEVVTSKQQFISFAGNGGIRTNEYIGTIAFKGHQLNIFPKIFREDPGDHYTDSLDLKHMMSNLSQWIQYCSRIENHFVNITSKLEDSDDLRELFVSLYIHYVKQAFDHGLFYRYETKKEDVAVLKGRVDFKDYINYKIPNGLANKFLCEFDEFEFDNSVNRIIKYTCKGLLDENISNQNKKLLRLLLIRLNGVSDVVCVPSDCDNIRLSKIHRQYSIIVSMSKMFIINRTTSYLLDNHDSFCFLFPTDLLFEGFIGGFIQTILEDEAKVTLQASDMSLISDVIIDNKSYGEKVKMRPDILVEHKEKGVFILDTKYKQMSRFTGVDGAIVANMFSTETNTRDIDQMLAYAYRRGVKDVFLLYPMYRNEELDLRQVKGIIPEYTGEKEIVIHLVRLPFVFEKDTEKTKQMLSDTIKWIVDQAG